MLKNLLSKGVGLLFGALPSWLPIALGGVLIASLVGGYFVLRAAWRAEGAAQVKLANAEAVIAQRELDMKLSALAIAELQEKVASAEAIAQPTRERIIRVPIAAVDDPAILAGIDGMRRFLAAPRAADT